MTDDQPTTDPMHAHLRAREDAILATFVQRHGLSWGHRADPLESTGAASLRPGTLWRTHGWWVRTPEGQWRWRPDRTALLPTPPPLPAPRIVGSPTR